MTEENHSKLLNMFGFDLTPMNESFFVEFDSAEFDFELMDEGYTFGE